jgi:hypothetical protein
MMLGKASEEESFSLTHSITVGGLPFEVSLVNRLFQMTVQDI